MYDILKRRLYVSQVGNFYLAKTEVELGHLVTPNLGTPARSSEARARLP
jgi:hypothetical protein